MIGEWRTLLTEYAFDVDACERLLDILDRRLPLPPLEHTFKGERLCALDFVQRRFNSRGRLSRETTDAVLNQAPVLSSLLTGEQPQRESHRGLQVHLALFPTREETTRLIEDFYGQMTAAGLHAAFDARAFVDAIPKQYCIAELMLAPAVRGQHTDSAAQAGPAATRLMLALERFAAIRGRWPETLDELASTDPGTAVPTDPVTGGPFIYRRVSDDPHGRGYLLYSCGHDGQDDSGTQHTPLSLSRTSESGTDCIFTRERALLR